MSKDNKTPAAKAKQAAEAKKALEEKKAAASAAAGAGAPTAAELKAKADKEAADKAAADKEAADKAAAAKKTPDPKVGVFVNPFSRGVTYKDFLAAIPKGKTVEAFCKGKLDTAQIKWLVNDLKEFKKKKYYSPINN